MGTSSSLINRRGVLLGGAAAAAAVSLPAGAVQPDLASPSDLVSLGIEFARLRRRCARQGRRVRQLAAQAEELAASRGIGRVGAGIRAHQVWSDAIDDALRTAEAISREQPLSLNDLLVQYEAIWWWIGEDDNVLDGSTRRWLTRFHHSLRRLVSQRVSSS